MTSFIIIESRGEAARDFIRRSFAAAGVAALLVAGAGSANAESSEVAAPKATDVAMLRGLLALQYPALRAGASTAAPAVPAVTVEPQQRDVKLPEIEGGASSTAGNRTPAI